jgi:hypothetical protein
LKTLKENDHWEDLGADGIKMDLRVINWKSMDWINLAEDRDQL